MIEILKNFPSSVLAFDCTGEVTKSDYETVLIPAVQKALKSNDKLRLYYRIGTDVSGFQAGAVWDDFKVGVEHLSRWMRAAVVTDSDSIRFGVTAFSFMIPGGVKVFPLDAEVKARAWILEDL